MMAHHIEQYRGMVVDCMDFESRLTEGERNFVESIKTQLDRNKNLSEKQSEVLDKIWNKALSHYNPVMR